MSVHRRKIQGQDYHIGAQSHEFIDGFVSIAANLRAPSLVFHDAAYPTFCGGIADNHESQGCLFARHLRAHVWAALQERRGCL
jgi:hypothetical protein